MVLHAQAGVLLAQALQRLRELLFLALVRRLQGQGEHRLRQVQRSQVDVLVGVGIVQHGVEMDVLDLGHRSDFSGAGLVHLDVLLALQPEQVPDLERLAAVVDEQLRVAAHRALVHAEHAELAHERIVDDLEHVGQHVPVRVRARRHRLVAAVLAAHEGRRVAFGGAGQQACGQFQQLLHAGAGARGDKADRHQVRLAQALLEGIVQFLAAKFGLAGVQVMLHHVLVDLHHLVQNLPVCFGQRGEIGLAGIVEEAVEDFRAAIGGKIDRQALAAELLAQFVHQCPQGWAVDLVDAVDHDQARQPALPGVVHHAPRAVLDAGRGVDDHGHGLDRVHGRQGGSAEIGVAGGVDQLDAAVAGLDAGQGGVDGMVLLALERVEVGHGIAAFDGACRGNCRAGQ